MGNKVKGRSGARGGGATAGLVKAKAVIADSKAEREKLRATAPEGEKVAAPPGLPAGWTATKHTVGSGKLKGKHYLRFASADGKIKDVSTVTQAIKKDAAAKGIDPEPALKQLEARRLEAEKKAKEGGASSEQKAVEAFRTKHGRLDRGAAGHLPGWTTETFTIFTGSGFDPSVVGQKATRYKGPKGESFTTLRQVEAVLGAHVLAGTDGELAAALKQAREMGKEEPKILKAKVLRRKAGMIKKRGKKPSKSSKKMDVDGKKKVVIKKKITKKKVR